MQQTIQEGGQKQILIPLYTRGGFLSPPLREGEGKTIMIHTYYQCSCMTVDGSHIGNRIEDGAASAESLVAASDIFWT